MRVGIETSSLYWNRQGGISRFTKNFLRVLKQMKEKDLEIFLFHKSPGTKPVDQLFPDITPPQSRYLPASFSSRIIPLRLHRRGLDIIHYPSEDLSPFFWLGGRKIIVTVHAAALHSLPYHLRPQAQPLFWWLSLRYLHGFIDYVLTDSEFAKKELIKYYKIPEEKIRVVHLGVNHDCFHPVPVGEESSSYLEKKYGVKRPYILDVCSSFQALKNIPNLIHAFNLIRKRYRKHQLVIAGKGGGWREEKTGQAIVQCGLEKKVNLAGYIEEKDLPLLYSAADLLVFPSFYEGFGFPVLEAMSCGCPVITSAVSSLPELVGQSAILINPHDYQEIAAAMERLLARPDLRKRLKNSGRRRAQLFSWEKTAHEILNVYRQCYDEPG